MTKNYILIHGAWHGSWCWYKILPRLHALGHRAIAIDLPGHYKNTHISSNVTFVDYVNSVIKQIQSFQQKVILVGHSMAGVVISQVAEYMPKSVERLVYVSGFVPTSGHSLMDEEKLLLTPTVSQAVSVERKQKMLLLPFHDSARMIDLFYHKSTSEDQTYALHHLQPQPLLPFQEKIQITFPCFGSVKKTYIACLEDRAISFYDQKRMISKIPCDTLYLQADHSPFFSEDAALAQMLGAL